MLRGILSAVVVLSLGILVLLTLIFAQSAKEDLRSEAKTNLNAAKEVIRLANRMNDYSLVYAAEEVATKDSLSHALGCPKDAADVARRNRPEIDPQTGQPVEQDTEEDSGSDDGSGDRVCVDSQHELSLRVLKSWAQAQSSVWRENEIRFLSDRPLGAAIPRAPDLFIVADEDGEVVARQGFDMDQYYGPDRPNMNQFEVVGRTQEMGVQHDVIMWKDYADTPNAEMMQVAAAPVFENGDEEGEFLGSVIIGYKINNQQATDLQDVLSGEDLLYFAATRSGEIGFAGNTLDRDPAFAPR
jgi:type II secretory pathway pseudopilin PulG